jgi:hexosaminidase
MYPRLSAIAELDWTAPALKNWTDFTNRLVTHEQRLAQAGINYNPYGTPPQLGTWSSGPATYSTLSWDITSNITNAGEVSVSFCWKSGTNRLDIAWAALLQNGIEIDRDTHVGITATNNAPTSSQPPRPVYVLRLPALRPGATYTLSASVQGHGGTNSNGIIYKPNWD